MRVIMLAPEIFMAFIVLCGGVAILRALGATPEDAEAALAEKMERYGVEVD